MPRHRQPSPPLNLALIRELSWIALVCLALAGLLTAYLVTG